MRAAWFLVVVGSTGAEGRPHPQKREPPAETGIHRY